jgi:hypothetical protein
MSVFKSSTRAVGFSLALPGKEPRYFWTIVNARDAAKKAGFNRGDLGFTPRRHQAVEVRNHAGLKGFIKGLDSMPVEMQAERKAYRQFRKAKAVVS